MKISELIAILQQMDQEKVVEYVVVGKEDARLVSCDVERQAAAISRVMAMFSKS